MKSFVLVTLGVLALGSMAGCVSSVDGENPSFATFNSTLADATGLGALSAEESLRFCNELAEWEFMQAEADMPATCRGQGFFAAELSYDPGTSIGETKHACQDIYQKCMNGGTLVRRSCDASAKYTSACRATVREAEACSTELIANWKASLAKAPACSELTASVLESQASSTDTPPALSPACMKVLSTCPAYFSAE